MKDYYQILGIPDNSSQDEIKRVFRKLAFKHHPDTNPGNEKQAEKKFKEINEAYGVLGDSDKRLQYDSARKGLFAGAGYGSGYSGFGYTQQDIFRDTFSNRATVDELNRMFAQAGLRFDQDFLNRVFFSGSGIMFQFFTSPGGTSRSVDRRSPAYQYNSNMSTYRPSLIEKLLSKVVVKVGQFVLRKLFSFQYNSLSGQSLDHHVDFEISPHEAATGGEKPVTYKRNGSEKKLVVKVPAGVRPGTRIKLKGMGMAMGDKFGDLYLHIKIKG